MKVREALKRIGNFDDIDVEPVLESAPFGYRNKVIYPLSRSKTGEVKAGYYQKGTHKIVNVNQCPVQDPRLDPLLSSVKKDLIVFEIYDENTQKGDLRSFSMRIGQRTDEILITLVSTTKKLPQLDKLSQQWMTDFPNVVGVCLNINPTFSNCLFGEETFCIQGRDYINELFFGMQFRIRSTTFFQIHTSQAEKMVHRIMEVLKLKGDEIIIDGYCGIGTMILPIAKSYPFSKCWAIDNHAASIQCAEFNAERHHLQNVQFKVQSSNAQREEFLSFLRLEGLKKYFRLWIYIQMSFY